MYCAMKTHNARLYAYRLGDGTDAEKRLIRSGAIRPMPNGRYELFSLEAVNGKGEVARTGDYFKITVVDGAEYPYPNGKDSFESHHRHIEGDLYEQIGLPFPIWRAGEPICDEMRFLLQSGRLSIDEADNAHYFNALLWNAPLSAAKDAVVVFYDVVRDSNGIIKDASFNFVAKDEFGKAYRIVECPD